MANITVPIQVNLPDDWIEQIVNRLRNDHESERVEIVRCRGCKHFQNNHICRYMSRYGTIEMKPDDFCSRAEPWKGEADVGDK